MQPWHPAVWRPYHRAACLQCYSRLQLLLLLAPGLPVTLVVHQLARNAQVLPTLLGPCISGQTALPHPGAEQATSVAHPGTRAAPRRSGGKQGSVECRPCATAGQAARAGSMVRVLPFVQNCVH